MNKVLTPIELLIGIVAIGFGVYALMPSVHAVIDEWVQQVEVATHIIAPSATTTTVQGSGVTELAQEGWSGNIDSAIAGSQSIAANAKNPDADAARTLASTLELSATTSESARVSAVNLMIKQYKQTTSDDIKA